MKGHCRLLQAEQERRIRSLVQCRERFFIALQMLREAGYTYEEMAQRFGRKRQRIQQWCAAAGVDENRARGAERRWASLHWICEVVFHKTVRRARFLRAVDELQIPRQIGERRTLYDVKAVLRLKKRILAQAPPQRSYPIPVPSGEKAEEWMSAAAAARLVGISRMTFMRYADEEQLSYRHYQGFWIYRRWQVEEVAAEFRARRDATSGAKAWKTRRERGHV